MIVDDNLLLNIENSNLFKTFNKDYEEMLTDDDNIDTNVLLNS